MTRYPLALLCAFILSVLFFGCRNETSDHHVHDKATKHTRMAVSDVADAHSSLSDEDSSSATSPSNAVIDQKTIDEILTQGLPSFMTEKDVVPVDRLVLLGDADAEEQTQIQAAFDAFKKAVLAYDPDAVQWLSDDSIQYYKYMLDLTRVAVFSPMHYDRVKSKLPHGLRTNIELLKDRLSASFIEQATPEALYQTAFQQGWIGYRSFQTASIGQIKAYDRSGERYFAGDFLYQGSQADKYVLRMGFIRTPDGIHIDLTPLFIGLEQAIEQMIQSEHISAEMALQDTVLLSQQSMAPEQWRFYQNPDQGFAIKFPKPPTEQQIEPNAVFSVLDHRYGQFGVVVDHCKHDCPTGDDIRQKRYLSQNIKALQGKSPDCRHSTIGDHFVVYCKFDIPDQHATMLQATVFLSDRVFRVFNQAPSQRFDLDTAQYFLNSFRFLNHAE